MSQYKSVYNAGPARAHCATHIWQAYETHDMHKASGQRTHGFMHPPSEEMIGAIFEQGYTVEQMQRYGFMTGDGRCINLENVINARSTTPSPGGSLAP